MIRGGLRTIALSTVALVISGTTAVADDLPSWRNSPTKRTIERFVRRVTDPQSSTFVPPSARIVVFDNDGTLWAEQPFYPQVAFAMSQVLRMAPKRPRWKRQEPFRSVLRGDLNQLFSGGESTLTTLVLATHAEMTHDEFTTVVQEWIETARHPKRDVRFTDLVYQPMLEVMRYFEKHEFRTFIVTGGTGEFVRAWAERVYGIPPERVVGSRLKTTFEVVGGRPVIRRHRDLEFVNNRENKPIAIQTHIGRRPIAAFGNSDGDLAMLRWTAAGPGRPLVALVHHTDAAREWAYDREAGFGRLDEALDAAIANRWTIVNIRRDWARVFPRPIPKSR